MTTDASTIGELAEDYARHLSVAVLKAGPCGRMHVQSTDPDTAASTPHAGGRRCDCTSAAARSPSTASPPATASSSPSRPPDTPSGGYPPTAPQPKDFGVAVYAIARSLATCH